MLPPSLLGFSLSPLEWHSLIREWHRSMRESTPVFYDQEQEYWLVFRYQDVERVLNDHETFSSEKRMEGNNALPSILSMDPPRHRQMRSLLTNAFSLRAIAQKGPRIAAITEKLLTCVIPNGEMDIIADLAAPLPTMVIAEMLGVPLEDARRINRWTDAIITAPPDEGDAHPGENTLSPPAAIQEMSAYFSQIIEEHRRHPQEDLISELLAADVNEQPLTELEVFGFCFTLLQASHIMTTNVIGNALLCFFAHGIIEQLRREPSLLPTAIEEALRYMPPMRGVGAGKRNMLNRRIALADTTIGDQFVRKYEAVNVSIGSANFDPRVFDNPDQFDIRRNPNRHLSFGHGIHFCMGAQLARLEIQTALSLILERLPGMQLKPGASLEQVRSNVLLGVKKLPIIFDHL